MAELRENYIITYKKKPVVIHSVLQFRDFVRLLDILFDAGYTKTTEISEDEFNDYYREVNCTMYKIDEETLGEMIKKLK
jgi:hypothetical protein